MDRKSLFAIVLCVVLYVVYSQYLSWRYPEYTKGQNSAQKEEPKPAENAGQPGVPPQTAATPTQPGSMSATSPGSVPAAPVASRLSDADLTVETDTSVYRFSQDLGAISSIQLKAYRSAKAADAPAFELLDSPLVIQGSPNASVLLGGTGFLAERQGRELRFSRDDGMWRIAQAFKIPESGYGLDVAVTYQNRSEKPQDLTAAVLMQETLKLIPASGGFLMSRPPETLQLLSRVSGSVKRVDVKDYCGKTEQAASGQNEDVSYLAFDRHYFLKALMPSLSKMNFVIERSGPATATFCPISMIAWQPFGLVQPGETVSLGFRGYFGPKEAAVLLKYEPSLKDSIDLGWFTVIAHPLLVAIRWFEGFTKNYGTAIIILTILLKILFYPLTKQASVSMKKMQKLQPEMNRIKEKFKDDQKMQQQELMKFMSAHKINPAKGCIPILPQIPVFVALYNVLANSIELRHAPFYAWIQDLSAADPYYVTPLLLGVGMFVQQKLTPNAGMDKTQQKIMMFMPVLFTVMMLSLPSGLVLYMLTNTIISIFQQQWLNRRLD